MISMKKKKRYDFIYDKNHIEIPSPVPVKSILLEKIREANIPKRYVIDKMATTAGCSVLHLPPYHCIFNPIEMI